MGYVMYLATKRTLTLITCFGALLSTGCTENAELDRLTAGKSISFGLHLVDNRSNNSRILNLAQFEQIYPPGSIYFPDTRGGGLLVLEDTKITQNCIKSATEGIHPIDNSVIVNFSLDNDCTEYFKKMTTDHHGKYFAIVVDGIIVSNVRIMSPINRGHGFFNVDSTIEQAKERAYLLSKAGRAARTSHE